MHHFSLEALGENSPLTLPDGRLLGVAEAGLPHGWPIFYFHGFPGSRLEVALMHQAALAANARIIGLDRPGYGLSSFQPGRSLSEWARDVEIVANQLHLRQFSVLGVSGGGPYALACAVGLPGRIVRAATVGGLGPLHLPHAAQGMGRSRRLLCALLRRMQWLTHPTYALVARRMRRNLPAELTAMIRAAQGRDGETLSRPAVRATLEASFAEALRGEARGGARDLWLYLSPWDFDLAQNRVPTTLWHGTADAIVPAAMTREMGQTLPQSETILLEEEGHYSLPVDRAAEILQRLCP